MTDSSRSRPAWNELMTRIRPSNTVGIPKLGRFRRNFSERVRIQAKFTKQNAGIVVIRENINTPDASAAVMLLHRLMLTQGFARWSPAAKG